MAQFFKTSRTKTPNHAMIKQGVIEQLDHQGRGMLFHHSKPVFVEGALPDEIVDIAILETKKRYQKGRVVKTHQTSPLRIEAHCAHYQTCGGCHLQHVESSTQINIKQQGLLTLFRRFAKYQPDVLAPALMSLPWQYRRCARFGVMYNKKTKKVDMGFRQAGSKALVEQRVCPVLVPALEALILPLKELLNALEAKMSLGHVELVEAEQGVAILLRHLKPLSIHDQNTILQFAATQQVHFYVQPNPTQIDCLTDAVSLTYRLPEQACEFEFNIDDFVQVNASVNEKMVAQALQWLALAPSDRVLDLFCGLGNFSLPLARLVDQVVAVEGVQKMVDRASHNAKQAGLENVQFYQADLSDLDALKADWAKLTYNKVLLDPARAGAEACLSFVASKKPSHIVYVSCDPVTLARDSALLLSQGYLLDKLGAIDMFPQTAHIESMALFIKK